MKEKGQSKSFYLITSLFFIWGFLTVLVDSLIPRLKELFELSYFEAGLIQFAFFMAYGVASIPSGELLQKIGYKQGIIRGLAVMGLGCLLFILAADARWYLLFLIGLFTLASGMTILQVAANPYVCSLGSERGASTRLNIAQGFNSIGTTIAPLVGALYLLSDSMKTESEMATLNKIQLNDYLSHEAEAIQGPFLILGLSLLVVALAVKFLRLPELRAEKTAYVSIRRLFKNKGLRLGAMGIFLYVGAEVAIGSYAVNYFLDMGLADHIRNSAQLNGLASTLLGTSLESLDPKAIVGAFVMFYWGGAMIGRFVGAFLSKVISPSKVLMYAGMGAITMLILSIATDGLTSMWSILAVGAFNSVMFANIFALSISDIEESKRPQASGILCTAIVGGAVIPPLLGLLIDMVDFKNALVLLVICYAYITAFANWKLFGSRNRSGERQLKRSLSVEHKGSTRLVSNGYL